MSAEHGTLGRQNPHVASRGRPPHTWGDSWAGLRSHLQAAAGTNQEAGGAAGELHSGLSTTGTHLSRSGAVGSRPEAWSPPHSRIG